MDSRKITEAVIKDLIGKKAVIRQEFEMVSDTNNIVSKIGGAFLKIYTHGKAAILDNELLLYGVTKNPELYKKLLVSGIIEYEGKKYKYGLFEAIKGKTLDEVKYTQKDATIISKVIYDHITDVGQINCNGFGNINENFEGEYKSFLDYINSLQDNTHERLKDESSVVRKYADLGYDIISDNAKLLDIEKPSLIPVDLNFKNFMITDDGKIKVVDHGALLAGPVEMAYGDVMAHGYGTKIYEEFVKHLDNDGNTENRERLMRIFATLSLANILGFIAKHTGLDPTLAKPFGNPNTMIDLIEEHTNKLKKQ